MSFEKSLNRKVIKTKRSKAGFVFRVQSCITWNGHEVNGIHGLCGKKGYDEALYSVNKRHDITGNHDINGKFPCDDIFRKNHARL